VSLRVLLDGVMMRSRALKSLLDAGVPLAEARRLTGLEAPDS